MRRQWFDTRIGDGAIERVLQVAADAGKMVWYTFKITTSDIRWGLGASILRVALWACCLVGGGRITFNVTGVLLPQECDSLDGQADAHMQQPKSNQ